MKIVRCLWGGTNHQFKEKNLKFYHDECYSTKTNDEKFKLENQVVFVWDNINREFIEKLNYPYYYMGESSPLDIEFNFIYKIHALKKAMELYDEILFLDWDFIITKELDETFFNLLRSRAEIQMPLYFYPKELLHLFKTINLEDEKISKYYKSLHDQMIIHCKWEFNGGLVIPNAGFIYCRDKHFFNNILHIQKNKNIITNIEELSAMVYFSQYITTMDEYIKIIEPIVCHGKIETEMMGKQILLNEYTNQKLNKTLYFNHI